MLPARSRPLLYISKKSKRIVVSTKDLILSLPNSPFIFSVSQKLLNHPFPPFYSFYIELVLVLNIAEILVAGR